jgi:hypothetical protein
MTATAQSRTRTSTLIISVHRLVDLGELENIN